MTAMKTTAKFSTVCVFYFFVVLQFMRIRITLPVCCYSCTFALPPSFPLLYNYVKLRFGFILKRFLRGLLLSSERSY